MTNPASTRRQVLQRRSPRRPSRRAAPLRDRGRPAFRGRTAPSAGRAARRLRRAPAAPGRARHAERCCHAPRRAARSAVTPAFASMSKVQRHPAARSRSRPAPGRQRQRAVGGVGCRTAWRGRACLARSTKRLARGIVAGMRGVVPWCGNCGRRFPTAANIGACRTTNRLSTSVGKADRCLAVSHWLESRAVRGWTAISEKTPQFLSSSAKHGICAFGVTLSRDNASPNRRSQRPERPSTPARHRDGARNCLGARPMGARR